MLEIFKQIPERKKKALRVRLDMSFTLRVHNSSLHYLFYLFRTQTPQNKKNQKQKKNTK
ncbi:hypothetical protein BpHYR1_028925 [Brachionus plicatilis]|uniref:Uncharacterized protein n=1 Tax=Brachionus plicatilis TaxID=10195 RepID=A0A3M7RQ55_BRAPC|nr:hypothetical protein BpHYR1_028925 [Brachionus plicatilis]